ncbi:DNA-3-methyladenine glycosylase I [Mangrovibacterium diazotrophicum]|uniref:DNA-3-methyladenine glycosylase I n=1 Tax=Mangrovibacterium diazotrophicum TaxID=1261403 RepID=A0A419W5S6_9BACT|nr:DNA-3-methyladenine glycosylase I [Mangrovibacterium diazotrophicum]RKD90802.1 DNA-3-methyladenine glycosylase I [Mangrovibacterium diazotrophicum]
MENRCDWCLKDDLYRDYHDQEWGVPVYDDKILFEFLILEGVQAGLSWHTVLKKRENYRKAYDDFDYKKVATYDEVKVAELLLNKGLVRNKLKIAASITNAQQFLKVQEEFGSFSNYIWGFVDHKPIINHFQSLKEVPATTAISDAISKDMKKRGFKFVGSTIVYAHMQATGMVNDHLVGCFRHKEVMCNE